MARVGVEAAGWQAAGKQQGANRSEVWKRWSENRGGEVKNVIAAKVPGGVR